MSDSTKELAQCKNLLVAIYDSALADVTQKKFSEKFTRADKEEAFLWLTSASTEPFSALWILIEIVGKEEAEEIHREVERRLISKRRAVPFLYMLHSPTFQ
jgi:hypothetical protein